MKLVKTKYSPTMKKLSEKEIEKKLDHLIDWDFYDNALHTDYEFDNFKDCIAFLSKLIGASVLYLQVESDVWMFQKNHMCFQIGFC